MKTQLTKKIEAALIKQHLKSSSRFATEVWAGDGICDFVSASRHYIDDGFRSVFNCYEIKISKSDFKSKNGHNFAGNNNYYVVPKELYSKIKELIPNEIGVIYYHNGCLRKIKDCKFIKENNTDAKEVGAFYDLILMQWTRGNMFRRMKEYEIL